MRQVINISIWTKKFVLMLLCSFSILTVLSQNETETAKPTTDIEVLRKVAFIDIEGKHYKNVAISLKSLTPDYYFSNNYRVKVKVVSEYGKSIYKKTYKNVFLYIFSNGQIQVGRKNFDQIIIYKSKQSEDYIGKIREKEGIY